MKTPNELKKIYNRLPKDKTELAKVELGIVDDLGKAMSKLEKSVVSDKEFEKSITEFNKKQNALVKEIQKMESAKDKLRMKGQKMLNQNNDIFDRVDGLLDKAKNAAKELGVKPESITNYKKAESLINKLVIANITRDLQDNGYF
tara:strand:+ start:396 stop:830 length:435 start_codon:yes stop_codon:yes gene_type:complete